MKQYVIIGNGTAAVGCIEGIRSVDSEGQITVISAEDRPAYCRPLISYYLEDRTDEKRMLYRAESFYEDMHCRVLYGKTAKELNARAKEIVLDDGERIPYDALCFATGSAPFVPPMEGIERVKSKFSFMTMEDAIALKQAVTPDSRVLIIGAGLIGLKCAEGLHGSVSQITVCDLADRILSSILDAEGSAVVQKHLEAYGICFELCDSVARFDGNTATMKSGKQIPFDILVTAVGVRANKAVFEAAGGVCERAITVDTAMKTSLPCVFAAGDCTESTDISDGKKKVMALMPNAYIQGHTAGVNMAQGEAVFDNAIPMNAIGFFGYHVMTAGSRTEELFCEVTDHTVKKLYWDGKRLTGFELIGDVKNAGIYTDLIRKQTDIGNMDKEKLKKTPNLSLFDSENRGKILKGVV